VSVSIDPERIGRMSPLPHITDSRRTFGKRLVIATLVTMTLAVAVLSMGIGRMSIEPLLIIKILLAKVLPIEPNWSATVDIIVCRVRLPRMLAGLLVGAGLSVAGSAFQGLFRNPLVSPHILGVTSGAGFGAALAILLFAHVVFIQIFSFAFGLAAVVFTYLLSRVYRTAPVLMLVLAGIIVGALFSASTSFLKYIADPVNQMPSIVFWLLGSLNNVSGTDITVAGPLILAGIIGLVLIRWRINIVSLGEEEARALGVHTGRIRAMVIVCATVISACAVSISGIIGWIGLVIPHIGRLLVGPDNRVLIPVSALIGAAYLVVVDTLARSLTESEIPIGILTAMVGAPIFAYLLKKGRNAW
jgi:iron complex transport system permease protein